MQPRSVLPIDDIALGDIEFWLRPWEEREGAFETLRRERPVSFHEEPDLGEFSPLPRGPGFWSLTRHADILEASRTPEVFCSGQGSNIGDLPPPFLEFFGSMINMDDPRHARLRRIVSSGFTPRVLKDAEDNVVRSTAEILDGVIEKGECDFVTDIAARLPLKIICDMMGIPESQHELIFEKTNVILGAGDPEYVPDRAMIIPMLLQAGAELSQLVQELGRERRKNPTNDLTSALVNSEVEGERLGDQELGSFFVLLVVAGNETTRNGTSGGMLAFVENPGEIRKLQRDPSLLSGAVEEVVRWSSPIIHFARTASRDFPLRDKIIREGDACALFYASANRDEEVWDDPFTFRVDRGRNPHLGFGIGEHFCVGSHLARLELEVAYKHLLPRIEEIELAGPVERLHSSLVGGVKKLPIRYRLSRA